MKISPSEVTRAPIDLVVYYNPPPKVIDKRLFEIVNRNSNNVVIVGDLNSPHTSFGSRITTDSGRELEDILAQDNLTLLNDPDSPTYHHPPEMLPNILDLAIVSGNLGTISSCKVGKDCGSFHLPIHVSINIGINKLPIKLIRPLKNIDWDVQRFELHLGHYWLSCGVFLALWALSGTNHKAKLAISLS